MRDERECRGGNVDDWRETITNGAGQVTRGRGGGWGYRVSNQRCWTSNQPGAVWGIYTWNYTIYIFSYIYIYIYIYSCTLVYIYIYRYGYFIFSIIARSRNIFRVFEDVPAFEQRTCSGCANHEHLSDNSRSTWAMAFRKALWISLPLPRFIRRRACVRTHGTCSNTLKLEWNYKYCIIHCDIIHI